MKPLREDEFLDADGGSEDSDCESGLEQASEPMPEKKTDGKGKSESERESLPVLTIGSFERYAPHPVLVELELLNVLVAGDRCLSICARTRYSLHRSNLKPPMCVNNTCKGKQRRTSLLPVHPKQSIPSHPLWVPTPI